jgi:hypothetical protein
LPVTGFGGVTLTCQPSARYQGPVVPAPMTPVRTSCHGRLKQHGTTGAAVTASIMSMATITVMISGRCSRPSRPNGSGPSGRSSMRTASRTDIILLWCRGGL